MFPLNAAAAASGGKVTVSGGTFTDSVPFGSDPECGIRFAIDNNVFRINTTGVTVLQVSALTDWLRPVSDPAAFEISCSNAGPDGLTAGSDVLDTFILLSTTREWAVERGGSSSGTDTVVLTISIRRVGTTTVLDSGVYTLNAERDTP